MYIAKSSLNCIINIRETFRKWQRMKILFFYQFGWKNDMRPNRKFAKDIVKQESTRYKYDRCL